MKNKDRLSIQHLQQEIRAGHNPSFGCLGLLSSSSLSDPAWDICKTWFFSGGHLPSVDDAKRAIAALQSHVKQFQNEDAIISELNELFMDWRNGMFDNRPPRQTQSKQRRTGFVYLIRNQRNGFTKIGYSKNPKIREETLQAQEPEVELLLFGPGTLDDESKYHDLYHSKRIRGEWFNLEENDIATLRMAITGTSL